MPPMSAQVDSPFQGRSENFSACNMGLGAGLGATDAATADILAENVFVRDFAGYPEHNAV